MYTGGRGGGGGGAYIVNVDWVTYLGAYISGGLIYGRRINENLRYV